jgi:hypothetical protein
MTLASQIISRAYRRQNTVAKVSSPDSTEQAEALALLNPIILSALGNEAGSELRDLTIGGQFDQRALTTQWVPADARIVLSSLSAATTLYLHPRPYEGQRLALADPGNTLTAHNLTLNGNGRQIEGAATLTLSTNGTVRQWMYRADTGNWVKIASLASSDTMPFPEEFDPYFINALAIELNPQNSEQTTPEIAAAMNRSLAKLRARYRRRRRVQEMDTLPRRGSLTQPYSNGSTPFW